MTTDNPFSDRVTSHLLASRQLFPADLIATLEAIKEGCEIPADVASQAFVDALRIVQMAEFSFSQCVALLDGAAERYCTKMQSPASPLRRRIHLVRGLV